MFGLGKTAVSASEATAIFIAVTAKAADDSYKSWVSELLQAIADGGIQTKTTSDLLNKIQFKYVYFAAICALGALAIENTVEQKSQQKVLKALFLNLQTEFNRHDRKIAEIVFNMIKKIKEDLTQKGEYPNFTCLSILLSLLEIDELEGSQRLFQNPGFALRLGAPLLTCLPDYWGPFSKKFKIA